MLPGGREGAASFVSAARPQRGLEVGLCLGHLTRAGVGYREKDEAFDDYDKFLDRVENERKNAGVVESDSGDEGEEEGADVAEGETKEEFEVVGNVAENV